MYVSRYGHTPIWSIQGSHIVITRKIVQYVSLIGATSNISLVPAIYFFFEVETVMQPLDKEYIAKKKFSYPVNVVTLRKQLKIFNLTVNS